MGVIAVFADTHRTEYHGLAAGARASAERADAIVHAGDFTTPAVLAAFEDLGAVTAVAGNNDPPALQARLPAEAAVEVDGIRVVVVHGHEHTEQALSLLGRDRDADVVVSGHSHRPGVVDTGDVTLLNPGSHEQPRQFTAAYATLERTETGGEGHIVTPGGDVLESFRFAVEGR